MLTEEEQSIVIEIATARPQAFGRPFNQWSLRKLRQFLVLDKKLITPVSVGTIRNVLKRRGITYQRTRTWKRSNDPHYEAKKSASRRSTARRQRARRQSVSTSLAPSRCVLKQAARGRRRGDLSASAGGAYPGTS